MIRPLPSPKRLRAALFDLDGTLIDSIELIMASYDHTYRAHGRVMSTEAIEADLGRPLHDTLAKYFHGGELKAAVRTYLDHNLGCYDAGIRRMAGVADLVARLRSGGLRLGVVTSKMRDAAVRGLALCRLDDRFEVVVTKEDTRRHNPDLDPLLYALALLELEAGEAAYVGDSAADMEAAACAGVRSIAALWRPAAAQAFGAWEPGAFARTPEEAAEILEAWRDGREPGCDETLRRRA